MKYKTIVIDFPWKVKPISADLSRKFHSPLSNGLPYKSMTKQEILDFPINDFADEQCALFMWTTHNMLPFALEVIKSWGFKYHCLMTWDKRSGINCFGFFRNSEFVIYGYRGNNPIILKSKKNVPTVFTAKRTGHSVKPDLFYNMLLDSTPEPRIDIFARKRHIGYDAWGDQVEELKPVGLFA